MRSPTPLWLCASLVGCGSSSPSGFVPSDAGTTAADGEAALVPTGDGGTLFGDALPPGAACSSDLQSVVNSAGTVVETCPSAQGCAGGICIPACNAAALSHGNVACDFIVATPDFYADDLPPCFAVFVANNWPHNVKITLSRAGTTYDASQFGRLPDGTPSAKNWPAVPATGLPTGKVAVLFLSQDPMSRNIAPLTCPVTPAVSQTGGTAATVLATSASAARGQAWHIATDSPVSAYDMLPYGGASSYLPSAELILPTTAWGTNYVAVLPKPTEGPPWGQIVAKADNTTVTILPTVDLPAGVTVTAAPQNMPSTFTLNAGEFIRMAMGFRSHCRHEWIHIVQLRARRVHGRNWIPISQRRG